MGANPIVYRMQLRRVGRYVLILGFLAVAVGAASFIPDRPGMAYHGDAAILNFFPFSERNYVALAVSAALLGLCVLAWVWASRSPNLLTVGDEGILAKGRKTKHGYWRDLISAEVVERAYGMKFVHLNFGSKGLALPVEQISLPLLLIDGQALLDDIERRVRNGGRADFAFSAEIRALTNQKLAAR